MLLRKIIFQVILDQADLYTNLFSPLVEDFLCGRTVTDDSQPRPKRIVAIVMEYLRSLEERQIPVQVRIHSMKSSRSRKFDFFNFITQNCIRLINTEAYYLKDLFETQTLTSNPLKVG